MLRRRRPTLGGNRRNSARILNVQPFRGATIVFVLLLLVSLCSTIIVDAQSTGSEAAQPQPCTVCPGGETITLPEQTLSLSNDLAFVDSCGTLETVIGLVATDSPECALIQSASSLCGCPTRENACSLCPTGGAVSLLDEDLTFFFADRTEIPEGIVPTCQLVEAIAKSYAADSQECTEVQYTAGVCGCPPLPDGQGCIFCPEDATGVTLSDKEVAIAGTVLGFLPTCRQIELMLRQVPQSDEICSMGQVINYLCGCSNGERDYLGAESPSQKRVLQWLPRVSAILSLLGSAYIIWDSVRDKVKRRSVYHQLMFAISVFDVFGSIAWGFTTLPIPKIDEFGEPSTIYGARGTEATCTAQGFFIQLGYTSIFYNMSLSFYYVMVIRYDMREHQIKKYQWFLFLPALIAGLGLACGGISHYENDLWGCYVAPPALYGSYRNIVIFGVFPICLGMFTATINMLVLYLTVRKTAAKARQWRGSSSTPGLNVDPPSPSLPLGTPTSSSHRRSNPFALLTRRNSNAGPKTAMDRMESKTFWQAVAFLGAFYLTWPIVMVATLRPEVAGVFPFMVIAFTLAPLQGFLNFLVYARPRFQQYWENRRRQRRAQEELQGLSEVQSTHNSSTARLSETAGVEENQVAPLGGLDETKEET